MREPRRFRIGIRIERRVAKAVAGPETGRADLVRTLRGDSRLAHLPIVMITSRIAEKHREHAKELGVNHYLGKPYSEDELLGLVKQYSRAVATA